MFKIPTLEISRFCVKLFLALRQSSVRFLSMSSVLKNEPNRVTTNKPSKFKSLRTEIRMFLQHHK